MAGAFLATNLITDSVTITPSTEDANYPKQNLYDWQAANVFRATSATSLSIELDFGAAVSINTIAIVNHNFTQGATVTLKGDNSSPPTTLIATLSWRLYNIWKAFTLTAARYWLLEISDSAPDVLEIGQLLLGQRTAFPVARRIASGYKPMRERAVIGGETYAGVNFNYYLFQRLRFNPQFRIASQADLDIFDDLDEETYGNVRPFLYIPDSSQAHCFYVRKEESFEPQEIDKAAGSNLVHDYAMELVEESRGLDILE